MPLKLMDVEANYDACRALKGISFEVPEGSIVALLGPNGAGKSTTLRVISGVIRPSAGTIEFDGQRLERSSPEAIVKFGIVHIPEGRRVFPTLTVLENLKMGAYMRRDASGIRDDLEKVYGLFPILKKYAKHHAGSLSGGEQQMLAIGRGLMARPRVLLLDEPSLGLSPKLVTEIFRIVRTINTENKTSILIVEQNARMALGVAHYGYVLQVGKIVISGTARELEEKDAVTSSYMGRVQCNI
ncbi:MAG: ABC transporter ATP-binding protein [Nitrospirae bacterium]|nr:ABC transporter ATP-binding protein [Nitrospirota bacterium]